MENCEDIDTAKGRDEGSRVDEDVTVNTRRKPGPTSNAERERREEVTKMND
jgi:hypothetical protein